MRILSFIALLTAGGFFAHSIVSGGLPKFYPDEISTLHSLDGQGLTLLLLLLPAVYVCLQVAVGFLLDRYGVRTTMMSAAILAALGLVLSVAVEIPAVGAAGRALHAVGAAFAFVGGLYIAARSFDKARFSTFAGIVQAMGFAGIGWWYLAGGASASLIDFQRRYYIAAGVAMLLALLFAMFGNVKPVQDGADRPGFMRQLLGEIGSVLIRPRLWLIMVAAAFAAAPLGLYAPIWIAETSVPAKALDGFDRADVATLFVLSFALGSLLAGYVGDGIKRRRGILVIFQLLAASAFAILAFSATLDALQAGALVVGGGFFAGSSILFYALGNDRAPPHHAGLFLGLIHAAFIVGAAGSVYAASYVQPWTDTVDLARYFAPICAAIAAALSLITPDKGPMAIAGPIADWEKTATIDVSESDDADVVDSGGDGGIADVLRDDGQDGEEPDAAPRVSSPARAGIAERAQIAETASLDDDVSKPDAGLSGQPAGSGEESADITPPAKSMSETISGRSERPGPGVSGTSGTRAGKPVEPQPADAAAEETAPHGTEKRADDPDATPVADDSGATPARVEKKAPVEPVPEKT